MRKFAVVTTLFVIALFAVPLGAAATGSGNAGASASCPLPNGPGAVVVDISNELMLAWDADKSTAGPVSVALPAGSWDVYLASYDDHSNKTHQSQLQEQWYLQGRLGETVVFTTGTTPDLPESTDVQTFAMGSLTTSQAIDTVLAVHAAFPSDEPHSVAPLCAAFYPAGTSPIAAPACPFPAGPNVVTISTELMLAWDGDSSTAGPVDFALGAGSWDVHLVSYDNHSAKQHQAQTEEQWYLQGWAGDTLVFTSAATPDLPEDTDYAVFAVGAITAAAPIDRVKAVHAAYPSDEPNSVAPLCAVFFPPGTTAAVTPTTASITPTTITPTATTVPPTTTTTTVTPTTVSITPTTTSGVTPATATVTTTTIPPTTITPTATTVPPTTTTAPGQNDSGISQTTVAAGLEGNTAQSLQQLPITGIELEVAFAAIVALMFGALMLRRAHLLQVRLDRREARAWRRQLS